MREFFAVLSRRKLAVLVPLILTPILAFANATRQEPMYAASADVLVTSGSVASALSELPGVSSSEEPERNARTQVELARLPRVAQRVIDSAPLTEDSETFLDRSSVSARPDADILRFTVEDLDRDQAQRLATIYGQEFTEYRNVLDLQAIRSMRQKITRTLTRLAAAGEGRTPLYAQLKQAERRLEAAEAVQGSAAILVQSAVTSSKVRPDTKRDIALGFALGLLLGVGLAFLVDRLDTRIRSAGEAEAILGIPVLGELSEPPEVPKGSKSVATMLEFPYGAYAEGVRKLRSNVEFARLDTGARVLMVTSAVAGEGKTTVASDLAIALARSGRDVVLCDLDARATSLHRVLGIGEHAGLVEVAFGLESLERALVPMSWATLGRGPQAMATSSRVSTGDLGARSEGLGQSGHLNVLTLGIERPPSPAEFVGSATVRQLIQHLASSHEMVILDTPPLLPVSDALTISEYVDAALIVVGLETSTRPILGDLRKLLTAFPTRVLGVAVTKVPAQPGYGAYAVSESLAPRESDGEHRVESGSASSTGSLASTTSAPPAGRSPRA